MNYSKIKMMQLDPFGFCNAKCWFCPVKYIPQPQEGSGVMSLDLIEKILSDLIEEKNKPDGVVDSNFKHITLSHYNEILLYKHFDGLLELLRKYSLQCYVLSNGVSLTKQKADLIYEYKDVVMHIGLNIPAFEKKLWASRSGFSEDQFERLINNVQYASEKLAYLGNQFHIGVNGLDNRHFNTGSVSKAPQWQDLNYNLNVENGEHITQFKLAKKIFPNVSISQFGLYDRAGLLDHIMTNKPMLRSKNKGKKVVGCQNWGDRSTEWLNINSAGSVFLCCNDYNFDYKFGDLTTQTVREVWLSDLRKQVVEKAYKEICRNCYSAKTI